MLWVPTQDKEIYSNYQKVCFSLFWSLQSVLYVFEVSLLSPFLSRSKTISGLPFLLHGKEFFHRLTLYLVCWFWAGNYPLQWQREKFLFLCMWYHLSTLKACWLSDFQPCPSVVNAVCPSPQQNRTAFGLSYLHIYLIFVSGGWPIVSHSTSTNSYIIR